jgi:hypothetical protein
MSKGEQPLALKAVPSKVICATRWTPPVGGTFLLEISVMPPLPKTCPKMVPSHKGVAFV